MSRSTKKGPFADVKLMKRVNAALSSGSEAAIRTWARSSVVMPEMIGLTIEIHDGRKFVSVRMNENMVGHKLGEFAPTRTFRGHKGKTNRD